MGVGWLLAQTSENTRDAYRRDLAAWFRWLTRHHVTDPFKMRRADVDQWARHMDHSTAKATVNRRVAAVSSWYGYCQTEDVTDVNPAARVRRHRIDPTFSPTFVPSVAETNRVLDLAGTDPRLNALVCVLLYVGARISEAVGADLADLTTDAGHPVLYVTRKGGKRAALPLHPPAVVDAINRWLRHRRTGGDPAVGGPVFVDNKGDRWSRTAAGAAVTALGAAAGCPRLTPHSLRHAFATFADRAGTPRGDLQLWMGHTDPATTALYVARSRRYNTHPGNKIAAHLGR
jgi:site-specific recombinase XerD